MRAAALDDPALDVLHRVADEVAQRLAAATDWGFSGRRDGQYAVDRRRRRGRRGDARSTPGSPCCRRRADARATATASLSSIRSTARRTPAVASRGSPRRCASSTTTGRRSPSSPTRRRGSGWRRCGGRAPGSGRGAWRRRDATTLDGTVVGISGLPSSEPWGWWQFRALGARPSTSDWSPRVARRLASTCSDDAHGRVGLPRRRAARARRPGARSPTPSTAISWRSTTPIVARRSLRRRRSCSTCCSATVDRRDGRRDRDHRSRAHADRRRVRTC